MSPDQQSNYWKHDPDEADERLSTDYPSETYEPTTDEVQGVVVEETTVGNENEAPQTQKATPTTDEIVKWEAPEYVHFDKGVGWFVVFALVVAGFLAIDFFLIRSWTFSALIIVMAIALIVYIRRPPRDVHYTLSSAQGLYVGERLYHLSEFKAFGFVKDGEHNSILLIPIKRFSPGVSVYFPEEVGEKVIDILGSRLPMETLKLDAVDVLIRKLRL